MPVRNHMKNNRHRVVPRYRWTRINIFRSRTIIVSVVSWEDCTARNSGDRHRILQYKNLVSVPRIPQWRIILKAAFVVFTTVFLAELGDKTQIATFLFATDPNLNRLAVFVAAATALVLSSLIAVLLGEQV